MISSFHMITQGAAQQSGRQIGITAAPCLSAPSLPPYRSPPRAARACFIPLAPPPLDCFSSDRLPPSPAGRGWAAAVFPKSAPGG